MEKKGNENGRLVAKRTRTDSPPASGYDPEIKFPELMPAEVPIGFVIKTNVDWEELNFHVDRNLLYQGQAFAYDGRHVVKNFDDPVYITTHFRVDPELFLKNSEIRLGLELSCVEYK